MQSQGYPIIDVWPGGFAISRWGFPHRGDYLLASLGGDRITGSQFCRAIGSGIDFGERASDALIRDLDTSLTILDVGSPARWYRIDDLRAGTPPLYPAGVLDLLQ